MMIRARAVTRLARFRVLAAVLAIRFRTDLRQVSENPLLRMLCRVVRVQFVASCSDIFSMQQDLGLPITSPLRVPGIMIVAGEQAMAPVRPVDLQEVD